MNFRAFDLDLIFQNLLHARASKYGKKEIKTDTSKAQIAARSHLNACVFLFQSELLLSLNINYPIRYKQARGITMTDIERLSVFDNIYLTHRVDWPD